MEIHGRQGFGRWSFPLFYYAVAQTPIRALRIKHFRKAGRKDEYKEETGRQELAETGGRISLQGYRCTESRQPVLEELYHDPDSKLHAQGQKGGVTMPDTNVERERHNPQVLVDTENLTREEWLDWRRRGIGGSDVSAIIGISPFRTARDIYYDKLGIAAVEEDEENWVAMEMGHLLEDLVAKIFERRTGLDIYQIKKMFRHPLYPFMLADVDYFITMPDGTKAILEIKTTNYNAKDLWWKDGRETVPAYYEAQGRHYMAVMDIDRVFFCCLYGNTEDETIIREIHRDMAYEEEMVFLEQEFWDSHVQKQVPPPYLEDGDVILASARQYCGRADKDADAIVLNGSMPSTLMRYMQLQEQKKQSDKYSKKLEADIQRLKAILAAEMGTSCKAVCDMGGSRYTLTYNPVRKMMVDKDNLMRLKLQYPEIYEQFVTVSEFRTFHVKVSSVDAA